MNSKDQDAKNRIIKAALEILNEAADVDKITVREIAERANVGTGLINYHFKSKDNLLTIAIGETMAKMAAGYSMSDSNLKLEPVEKLKTMLKELFNYAEEYEKLMLFSLTHEIINGDMQAPLFLVPVLREIFGNRKDEMQLRVVALQILLPLQVTSIKTTTFRFYSGIDLQNKKQRNAFIDELIDNLVK